MLEPVSHNFKKIDEPILKSKNRYKEKLSGRNNTQKQTKSNSLVTPRVPKTSIFSEQQQEPPVIKLTEDNRKLMKVNNHFSVVLNQLATEKLSQHSRKQLNLQHISK